ncbi:MAG: MBL fold metallo-hydrolase, partial [Candidatus ainarchaeum sp.]|nr:MBL fold metallo-hydrolase [Candidatus ainarchaeum sp.]
MKKTLFLLILGLMIFYGCINLDVGEKETDGETTTPDGETIINTSLDIGDEQGGSNIPGGGNNGEPVGGDYDYQPDSGIAIYFIDVGRVESKQGEAILIKKGEYEILVDTGPEESDEELVSFLKNIVEGDLEILVLTHDDEEHWGGTENVLDNFKIKTAWVNKKGGSDEYNNLISKIEGEKITVNEVKRGYEFNANGAQILV